MTEKVTLEAAQRAARRINEQLPTSVLDEGLIVTLGVSEAALQYEHELAQIIIEELSVAASAEVTAPGEIVTKRDEIAREPVKPMASEAIEKIVVEVQRYYVANWDIHIPSGALYDVASRVLEEAAQATCVHCRNKIPLHDNWQHALQSESGPFYVHCKSESIRSLSGGAQEEKP